MDWENTTCTDVSKTHDYVNDRFETVNVGVSDGHYFGFGWNLFVNMQDIF